MHELVIGVLDFKVWVKVYIVHRTCLEEYELL